MPRWLCILCATLAALAIAQHSAAQQQPEKREAEKEKSPSEEESLEEGKKRLARITEDIRKHLERNSSGRAGAYGSRGAGRAGIATAVPADAMKQARGQPEDELRMYFLASFRKGELYEKVKDILNSPWDAKAVKALWKADSVHYPDWRPTRGRVLNLLVHAAAKYNGEVLTEVKSILKDLFTRFSQPGFRQRECRDLFWATAVALRTYGVAELLPASFWSAIEREEIGASMVRILGRVGNGGALKLLEEFQESCKWKNLRPLNQTMKELKEKLAKEKAEEKAKPEQRKEPKEQPQQKQQPEDTKQQPQPEKTEPEQKPPTEPSHPQGAVQETPSEKEPQLRKEPAPAEREAQTQDVDWFATGLIIAAVAAACVLLLLRVIKELFFE